MKSNIFASLFFVAQLTIASAQPGDLIVCEIAIEYSSLDSNLESLNANYQIIGISGIYIPENDSLTQRSSSVSCYSSDVLENVNDTLQIVKKAIFSDSASTHIFFPMPFNRYEGSNNQLYQYTIKIVEKRSHAEMTIAFIGKTDDFFTHYPFLELTNLSFHEGVYLFNLNDNQSFKIPEKYSILKTNKLNSMNQTYRSCKISDINSHSISMRKMKQIVKKQHRKGVQQNQHPHFIH
jgi:hypothetical protein